MSLSSNKKKFAIRASAVVASFALVGAVAVMSTSGADFTASDNGHASVHTATLSLDLGDANGWQGTFNLNYDDLTPGQIQSQTFYVKNTGSIPASVSLTNRTTSNTAGATLTGNDWEEFKSGVDGYSGMVKSNVGLNADLGILQPGEQRGYNLLMGLDSTAGNEWQGVGIGTNVVVTLNQLH